MSSRNERCLFILSTLGLFAVSCATAASYRLATPASEARTTFPAIGACATKQGLESIEHPASFNVKLDAETWIQYMVQQDAFNMVVVVGNGVPEPERPARSASAKTKGDELFDCALKNPVASRPAAPSAPAAAPPVAPASSAPAPDAQPTVGGGNCVSAMQSQCTQDYQCQSSNCTAGYCQGNAPGSLCQQDYHCATKNCSGGCCQTNDPGAACQQDYHCESRNCTDGKCQTNERGAACQQDYHCKSRNCTAGHCQ